MMGTMKVEWHNTEYGLHAEVLCAGGQVRVNREARLGSQKFLSAEVNWSAIGAQPAETAIEYATAILLAAQVAQEMNGEVFTYTVTLEYLQDGAWKSRVGQVLGNNEEQVRSGIYIYGGVRGVYIERNEGAEA